MTLYVCTRCCCCKGWGLQHLAVHVTRFHAKGFKRAYIETYANFRDRNGWNPWSPYGIHMEWYQKKAAQKVWHMSHDVSHLSQKLWHMSCDVSHLSHLSQKSITISQYLFPKMEKICHMIMWYVTYHVTWCYKFRLSSVTSLSHLLFFYFLVPFHVDSIRTP